MKKDNEKVEKLRTVKNRIERDLRALEVNYKIGLIKMDTVNQELSEFTMQIEELNRIIKQ